MRNGIDQPYTGLTEDQYNDLNTQLFDLIQSLPYKVDTPDLINALKVNLDWFEMNDPSLNAVWC
jgi:hypothetical protein